MADRDISNRSGCRRRDDERGTALVEFSISAALLLVLLFGIASYGYMLSFKQGLTQAAAEGARAAAVEDPGAEPLDHRRQARLPRLDNLPGEGVGVDHDRAPGGQGAGHRRLSRTDPTTQTDTKHAEGW